VVGQSQFPRVSDEDLLRLKRAVAENCHDRPIVVRAFCWLLDKTEGLTKQVAVYAPSSYRYMGTQIALGFHDLRSATCVESIAILMKEFGNGFITWSCCNRHICGEYDDTTGGNTFRLAITEHGNKDEIEVQFDFPEIMDTPLPE
jgi:hypothetical protein